MAKIAQISSKYIVHATIQIDGVVDKPDVIGAIFGQTEGLLGEDLELRELQRSGRIGRIEVNVSTKLGKTTGEIIIPSSLDKAETAIIGAALEVIQRIGPCIAKVKVEKIEDVRISKREYVINRAKELLKTLMDTIMPDSAELSEEVSSAVRVMEIHDYGRERLPAGPAIDESDEIIVVEGRADVLNLLKHGFKNVIAINGTSIPETIKDICRKKTVTVFVDGDRGGDLIIKELMSTTEIDFVTKAPDGKEVEELTKKEIHKSLRGRIAAEQFIFEFNGRKRPEEASIQQQQPKTEHIKQEYQQKPQQFQKQEYKQQRVEQVYPQREQKTEIQRRPETIDTNYKELFARLMEDLLGTHGAYILDENMNILGKVPGTELESTIKSLRTGIKAIIFDGEIDKGLLYVAERAGINFLICMKANVSSSRTTKVITIEELMK